MFRIFTRRRGGYDGATMVDVQLAVASTGAMVWSQTYSDPDDAEAFQTQVEADLDTLDDASFRRRYGVPASA